MSYTSISSTLGNLIDQYPGNPFISEERGSCGVGFLVDISNSQSKRLIVQALKALTCMEHRGACGADYESGDGSGVTTQIPWQLFRQSLPNDIINDNKTLAVGMFFLPSRNYVAVQNLINWILQDSGRYQELAAESRNKAVSQFALSIQSQRYSRVFHNLCSKLSL